MAVTRQRFEVFRFPCSVDCMTGKRTPQRDLIRYRSSLSSQWQNIFQAHLLTSSSMHVLINLYISKYLERGADNTDS